MYPPQCKLQIDVLNLQKQSKTHLRWAEGPTSNSPPRPKKDTLETAKQEGHVSVSDYYLSSKGTTEFCKVDGAAMKAIMFLGLTLPRRAWTRPSEH